MIKSYRKKPIVIQAEQFQAGSHIPFKDQDVIFKCKLGYYARTPQGPIRINNRDWVIQEDEKFYACKPEIFEATYEEVTL